MLIGAIIAGVLLLAGGVGLAAFLLKSPPAPPAEQVARNADVAPLANPALPPAPPKPVTSPPDAPRPEPEKPASEPPPAPPAEPVPAPAPNPEPMPSAKAPMPPMPAPAEAKKEPPALTKDEIAVNECIDRGVACLKKYLKGAENDELFGRGNKFGHLAGERALIGWTLLECGVPASDPDVQELAAYIRKQEDSLNHTYSIALALFFLDRLGDPKDQALIETFGLRLVAGQVRTGAWSYHCPILEENVQKKLAAYLRTNANLVPGSSGVKTTGLKELPAPARDISSVIWLNGGDRALAKAGPPAQEGLGRGVFMVAFGSTYDNSNTQFALMGLWVAKRNGAPVQPALALQERHFRRTQRRDGGWGYNGTMETSPCSMTSAGLVGLAVGHGTALEQSKGNKKPAPDANVALGFKFLAANLANEVQNGAGLRFLGQPAINANRKPADAQNDNYYLFWSVERVGVIFDLKSVGGKEWYPWLSKRIVKAQTKSGGWYASIMGNRANDGPISVPYSCFALLVLKRANVAPDLTKDIRKSVVITSKDVQLNITAGSLVDSPEPQK
jgi:hypothetical protein